MNKNSEIYLTVETAKEIAMITENKQGEMTRDYFIIMANLYKNNINNRDYSVLKMSDDEIKKAIFTSKKVRHELIKIEAIMKNEIKTVAADKSGEEL
jgi:phage anti-repressor protein